MFSEQINDFLLYISSEKGLSKNTQEAYQRDLVAFTAHLEKIPISDFSAVEQMHVVEFLAALKDLHYAQATISRVLISIKVLFRFLKREQKLRSNVTLYLDSPKLWQIIPEVLTSAEVEVLLKQPDVCTSEGARDRAIIEVLYASGLRVSELCTLGIYDVDDTFVRVIGKGNKERVVPIGSKAIEAIDFYLAKFRGDCESDRRISLFISKSGKPMNRQMVWKLVKKYAKQAGLKKNISPHTFRHSFATHLLDNGADLRIIQEMLGHGTINSTDRYTQVSRKHIQKAFETFHPRF